MRLGPARAHVDSAASQAAIHSFLYLWDKSSGQTPLCSCSPSPSSIRSEVTIGLTRHVVSIVLFPGAQGTLLPPGTLAILWLGKEHGPQVRGVAETQASRQADQVITSSTLQFLHFKNGNIGRNGK